MITIGEFTLTIGDRNSVSVAGPERYMHAKGYDRLLDIEQGKCMIVNDGMRFGSDLHTSILVAMQTSYSMWMRTCDPETMQGLAVRT